MNAIEFAVEDYKMVVSELRGYYQAHYDELASNKEIPLAPDYAAYDELYRLHRLHVVTARRDGVLVGYFISTLGYHLHYRDSLTAWTDIYYLRPDCRHGRNGVNLFKFMEDSLNAMGVERIYTSTKTELNNGPMLEALGYAPKEVVYTKILRGM